MNTKPVTTATGQRIHVNEEAIVNFWNWYQESILVDRKGRPIVLYHRTAADFDTFDTRRGDLGVHLGTLAQSHGLLNQTYRDGEHIVPVFARLENPLRLTDKGGFHADAVAPQLQRLGLLDAAPARRLAAIGDRGNVAERRTANDVIKQVLVRAGYDGVVYRNLHEGRGDSYIIFDASQIKSSVANSGAFAKESASLTDRSHRDLAIAAAPSVVQASRPRP